MGLFDRLTDLLGGGRTEPLPEDPPGGEQDPAAPPRDHPSKQSHGSHWDTVVAPERREAAIRELATRAVENGEPSEGHAVDGRQVTGYRLADGPLGVLTVTVEGEVVTAYPVGAGSEVAMNVTKRDEWTTGVEAWLTGSAGDAALTVFGTNYYAHPGRRFEGGRSASLAGFLYEIGPAGDETVVDADGDEFAIDPEFAGFTPWEAGAVDDYVLRTVPETVERVSLSGHEVHRIEAPLFREPDGDAVDCVLYAGTHLGDGYEPTVGEPFQAPAWLQARVN